MLARIIRALRIRLATCRALRDARQHSQRMLARGGARRVLVLCYGNIYRSPFVAASLRKELGGAIEVRSAGFHAKGGRPSPSTHVSMSADLGVMLADHRSAMVTPADLEWADLIVLMDRYNWARLAAMNPDPQKVIWLGSLAAGSVEIPDPYGLPEEQTRGILERLAVATSNLVGHLRKS